MVPNDEALMDESVAEPAWRPRPAMAWWMVSPALVLVAREGRQEAGAAVFLLGGIPSDQAVLEAGWKTLVGYCEMDEDG